MQELIVISLAGDWQDRKRATEAIQDTLKAVGGKMIEGAIKRVFAIQNVPNEVYYSFEDRENFNRNIKESIASAIGLEALKSNSIEFSENQDRFDTAVNGELLVIKLRGIKDNGTEKKLESSG